MSRRQHEGRLDHVRGEQPYTQPYTPRTPRIVAARRLHRRRDRDSQRRFLVEGPQAVREALTVPGTVVRAVRHRRRR